jgi:hypothetical protein
MKFEEADSIARQRALVLAKGMHVETVSMPSDEDFSLLGLNFSIDAIARRDFLQEHYGDQFPALFEMTVRWLWYSVWYAAFRSAIRYKTARARAKHETSEGLVRLQELIGSLAGCRIGDKEKNRVLAAEFARYQGWAVSLVGFGDVSNEKKNSTLATEFIGNNDLPSRVNPSLVFDIADFYFCMQAAMEMKKGNTKKALDWLFEVHHVREYASLDWSSDWHAQKERKLRRKGGQARQKTARQARQWVWDEWVEKRAMFANNKSAFARQIIPRLSEKFHEKFTEKTIRDVWLSGPPNLSAS